MSFDFFSHPNCVIVLVNKNDLLFHGLVAFRSKLPMNSEESGYSIINLKTARLQRAAAEVKILA